MKEKIDKIIVIFSKTRPKGLEYSSEEELCIQYKYNRLEEYMLEFESELEQQQANECSNTMLNLMHVNELHLL